MGKSWALLLVTVLIAGGLALLVATRLRDRSITALPDTAPPVAAPKPRPADPMLTERKKRTDYLGVIVADQTVDVAANLDGRIAEVLVRVGERVSQGAPLAYLDQRTIESDLNVARAAVKSAKADQAKARLEIADAETKLRRSEKLGSLIPATELEAARSERKLASTRLESARAGVAEAQARVAKLEVSRTDASVRAPFTGVVAARYLDPGSLVTAQSPIVRLISSEAIRVRFAVPEDQARMLIPGGGIEANLPALGVDLHGTIETVAPEVDPAARMIFAEGRLDPSSADVTARPAAGLVAWIRRSDAVPK